MIGCLNWKCVWVFSKGAANRTIDHLNLFFSSHLNAMLCLNVMRKYNDLVAVHFIKFHMQMISILSSSVSFVRLNFIFITYATGQFKCAHIKCNSLPLITNVIIFTINNRSGNRQQHSMKYMKNRRSNFDSRRITDKRSTYL